MDQTYPGVIALIVDQLDRTTSDGDVGSHGDSRTLSIDIEFRAQSVQK